MEKRHLLTSHIAGFSYWDGAEAFSELKIGTTLKLVREPDNKFDPYAVAIYYEDYKLGFIPRDSNHEISKYLEMGYGGIYDVRINRISPESHPEDQIGFIIRIKARE
ncbi:MAG: HIRAN domain-containing protein [Bacteroidales bacterium]|nr:HIRAN domain-containing protein [Bacteroidales bacterium]